MGVIASIKTAARKDAGIVLIGAINSIQLISLLVGLSAIAAQLVYGASVTLMWIAAGAAASGVVIWLCSTIFGAMQYHVEIQTQRSIDELLGMTEALQSTENHDDTASVLMATSLELLPQLGGALYVFNNSRDRLDLSGSWNIAGDYRLAETICPTNCWSLKRGKAHINVPKTSKLRCAHHVGEIATLEVPMVARGAIYGLLIFTAEGTGDASSAFATALRHAQAMADATSLSLSNIALREKLRTQSLRDPLTGLFNRRYMEDALERYVSLADRSGTPTSVLMLDLDNFKRLNDEHGHAKGDAVLRDVAAQLLGGVRPSDVVCRYGGEEIMVILPDCSAGDAVLKAEELRLRVAGLSDVHGTPVTVSIGVASIPDTSSTVADLVAMADKALYAAKGSGKNRVVCSPSRAEGDEASPRLAVANRS